MNHTPTPWDYSASGLISGDLRNDGDDSTDVAYCNMEGAVGRIGGLANAALIVKSVNAHDELVAALRSAEQAIVHGIACAQTLYEDFSVRMESFNARAVQNSLDKLNAELAQARAALAKVQS